MNQDLTDMLVLYERLGFNVIPIIPRDKRPALASWTPYQTRMSAPQEHGIWWPVVPAQSPQNNVGIVTGNLSKLLVFDFDDDSAYAAAYNACPLLKGSMTAKTGRGFHVYFRCDTPGPTFTLKWAGNEKGVHHIKAEPAYVVAPPSIHPNGHIYRFINKYDPARITDDDLHTMVEQLKGAGFSRAQPAATERPLGFWPEFLAANHGEGERNQALIQLGGVLRHGIVDWRIALELARSWNKEHLDPPLPDGEVVGTIKSAYRYESRPRCDTCGRPFRSV